MRKYYVDTHCHLDLMPGIQNQVDFEDSQLIKTITVTNTPAFFEPNESLFRSSKNIRVAIGLHPELCLQYNAQLPDLLKQLHSTRYIGEIGIDGSSRFKNSYDAQREVFETIANEVSLIGGKIITVHSRGAASDVIEILNKHKVYLNNKVILHWYTGDKASLIKAAEMGLYFSTNHKMVSTKKGIEIVKAIPKELLLTETDAPFTFDTSIQSRTASLKFTCAQISNILGIIDAQELVYENFRRLLMP